MRGDSIHEVGKLINYFENFVNDLNKDVPTQSKWKSSISETHLAHPAVRTTSENTSNLSITFNDPTPSVLPPIRDEEIYDHLNYQTLVQTESTSIPNDVQPVEQTTQSSKHSCKRRHQATLHRKRLHRRRAPTYIKELKAYLAHRQSSVADLVKISDVKKFSHVLVWLANQRSSPDENPPLSNSITPDPSDKRIDQPIIYETTKFSYLIYDQMKWKLKIRKEVFSPLETFDEPFICELLYRQIVFDTFSSNCLRIFDDERRKMKRFLASNNVTSIDDVQQINDVSLQRTIVEKARRWSIYFSRLFPISFNSEFYQNQTTHFFGISHRGIQWIDWQFQSNIELVSFDSINEISSIKNEFSLEIFYSNKSILISSRKIRRIRSMIETFLDEFRTIPNEISVKSVSETSQTLSEFVPSRSPTNHSMMEFAVQNYQIPIRRSKKTVKTSEWTWQDYSAMIKWSKVPLQTSLLRRLSNRLARSSFLAIMRFMGDYPMGRSQTEMDCLVYLLKTMQKHNELIDEVFCQLLKQLTENRSVQTESIERGWKLLVILLNYFLPDERLRIYLLRFFYDHRNENERFVHLASNHYDQTLKYGGRKVLPNRSEIDLLLAQGKNGGKRQTFLLPGGFPLTFLISPSMVIADCLQMLCDKLEVPNKDEYSIFLITSPKSSSRLINSNEYLFDILNDSLRSSRIDFHLIIKRTLWLNEPLLIDIEHLPSNLYIDTMFYQVQSEYSQGTLLSLPDAHLSQSFMNDIARLVALQYRISNRTNLPTMKDIKELLPSPLLKYRTIHPQQWTNLVHEHWQSKIEHFQIEKSKIEFLNLIQTFPLTGTTTFAVQILSSTDLHSIPSSCLIGVSKRGISYLESTTREILLMINYSEFISIRREQKIVELQSEENTIRCQIDRTQDFVTLVSRYLNFTSPSTQVSLSTKLK